MPLESDTCICFNGPFVLSISDAREVFDLFDFWDGRDGEVDAFKLGDLLRCLGHNPTQATVAKHGGTQKMGKYKTNFLHSVVDLDVLIYMFYLFMNEKELQKNL